MGVLTGPEIYKPTGVIDEAQYLELKDGSQATLYPIYPSDVNKIPESLIDFLWEQFNVEVEKGDTYPYLHVLSKQEFLDYWFGAFHALLLRGREGDKDKSVEELFKQLKEDDDWNTTWLGSYYIKPNYAGRCSHNCNAGFLVNPQTRGLSVGKTLGKSYLKWAPILGYVYSVFNLVFVTNVASVKIWDSLGFDRIGLVPGVGVLKGHEERVDAILFGKSLI